VHPFREGNGRAQRALFGQLARDAGFTLAWQYLDPVRNVEASAAIMRGDPEPMREMLDALIRDSTRPHHICTTPGLGLTSCFRSSTTISANAATARSVSDNHTGWQLGLHPERGLARTRQASHGAGAAARAGPR
jgi:hypothetical protein